MHSLGPFMGHGMGTEALIKRPVGPLDQQMVVHLAQHRAKGVGVAEFPAAAGVFGSQPIGVMRPAPLDQDLEESVGMTAGEGSEGRSIPVQKLHSLGTWSEAAYRQPAAADDMGPKDGEGVRMARLDDGKDIGLRCLPSCELHSTPGDIAMRSHVEREPALTMAWTPVAPSYNGSRRPPAGKSDA